MVPTIVVVTAVVVDSVAVWHVVTEWLWVRVQMVVTVVQYVVVVAVAAGVIQRSVEEPWETGGSATQLDTTTLCP